MKVVLTLIFLIGVSFNVCFAQEKPELKEGKEKESYSLGYQFGQSLKAQGVDIDLEDDSSSTE